MVTFHARATLGLGLPVPSRLRLRTQAEVTTAHEGLTWHWTGADGNLYKPDPITRLRAIFDYHVHVLGYGDIAYHGAYDADGNTYGLRDARYVGAHAKSNATNDANRLTDGIVFLEDARKFTTAAEEAFNWWERLYVFAHRRKPKEWTHHAWAAVGGTPTACPGPYITANVHSVGGHV